MKLFVKKLSLFVLFIVIIDGITGFCCAFLNRNAKGGETANRYYIFNKSSENLLLMGSSRMKHHYVTKIFADSLNMTAYNCGQDGNGIILTYGMYKMISNRYSPHYIIYDVAVSDMYTDDVIKYLSYLKIYSDNNIISSYIKEISFAEWLKSRSNLFRYNTECVRMLADFLIGTKNHNLGYSPHYKTMDYEPYIKAKKETELDSVKLHYIKEFICSSKENNIKIIFAISPSYNKFYKSSVYSPIKRICANYNIPLIDFSEDPDFSSKKYFMDPTHLNNAGAELYSKKLISRLKQLDL